MKLLLHEKTEQRIQRILENPPHAILITGKMGSGKSTLSEKLAADLINSKNDSAQDHPYIQIIDPADNSISIDEIRNLQRFLKLRVPGNHSVNRIILIKDAERMRSEAQNALLKTLEEPPKGTIMILTAASADNLLPTITSRAQLLEVLPISMTSASKYYGAMGIASTKLTKHYALSGGQAGLLHALLHDTEHPLVEQVEIAKTLLAKKPAERLLATEELSKDKQALKLLLDAFLRICHAALSASGLKQDMARTAQWHARQVAVLAAQKHLNKNAHTKLVLDDLFLSL